MTKHVYRRRPDGLPSNLLLMQFLETWQAKRDARRFPSRDEMGPRDLVPLLPYAVLARVVDAGRDFEFRVIGNAVIEAYGQNFMGQRLSALGEAVSEPMREAYYAVSARGEPVMLEGWFERPDHDAFRREVLLVPLGPTDDNVDHILSAGVYEPHNPIAAHDFSGYESKFLKGNS